MLQTLNRRTSNRRSSDCRTSDCRSSGRAAIFALCAFATALLLAPTGARAQGADTQLRGRVETRSYRMKEAGGKRIPYALYVPRSYDKSRGKRPLVVMLHGLGGTPQSALRYRGLTEEAERRGFLAVAPYGFNRSGWYGARGPGKDPARYFGQRSSPDNLGELSEKDVLNVLAIVRREFRVDPDRIYLMGHSMGGSGALYLGAKYAARWAAVAAFAPATGTRFGIADALTAPIMVVSGDRDRLVPVRGVRRLVDRLRARGKDIVYEEIADGNHSSSIARNPEMMGRVFAFLASAKRGTARRPVVEQSARSLRERDALVRLAERFGRARARGDTATIDKISVRGAKILGADGSDLRPLRAPAGVRRPSQGKDAGSKTFVRAIEVRDRAARIVVLDRARNGRVLRRSLECVRAGSSWRIAHVHESRYTRFEKTMQAFDAASAPERSVRPIVFVGSSSIRRWDSLARDFEGLPVVQRGFGGSELVDAIVRAPRIRSSMKPRAYVVYAGDNDIARGKTVEQVVDDFKTLVAELRADAPRGAPVQIYMLSIKPSRARWELWPRMRRANAALANVAASMTALDFVDVATPLLGEDGEPRDELFVEDRLHLSAAGYAIWTEVLRAALASDN